MNVIIYLMVAMRNEYSATVAPFSYAFLKQTCEKTAITEKIHIDTTATKMFSFFFSAVF